MNKGLLLIGGAFILYLLTRQQLHKYVAFATEGE